MKDNIPLRFPEVGRVTDLWGIETVEFYILFAHKLFM